MPIPREMDKVGSFYERMANFLTPIAGFLDLTEAKFREDVNTMWKSLLEKHKKWKEGSLEKEEFLNVLDKSHKTIEGIRKKITEMEGSKNLNKKEFDELKEGSLKSIENAINKIKETQKVIAKLK